MKYLDQLKFTEWPDSIGKANTAEGRRDRFVSNVQDQKRRAHDNNFQRNGRDVRAWWKAAGDGKSFALSVRANGKRMVLPNGKTAITVPASADGLIKALDILIEATKAGELDKQLEKAANESKKKKKAAA
jgi:hypothetical protein